MRIALISLRGMLKKHAQEVKLEPTTPPSLSLHISSGLGKKDAQELPDEELEQRRRRRFFERMRAAQR